MWRIKIYVFSVAYKVCEHALALSQNGILSSHQSKKFIEHTVMACAELAIIGVGAHIYSYDWTEFSGHDPGSFMGVIKVGETFSQQSMNLCHLVRGCKKTFTACPATPKG